jgi:hypothetical protein
MATPSKAKSWVWKYFLKEDKEVQCTECKKNMAFHGGTSSMAFHLENVHGFHNTNAPVNKSSPSVKQFFTATSKRCTTDRAKDINKKIAAFLAKDMRPINVVEVSISSLLLFVCKM